MNKKDVIDTLQSYNYNSMRYRELKEKLESICCKTTPTYGNLAASSGGGFNSKVEDTGNRRIEIKQQMLAYKREIEEIERMIEHSGLDEREKGVMWWIAKCGRLSVYARREHIGKDNIYKIRDRAVKKIIAAHKNT